MPEGDYSALAHSVARDIAAEVNIQQGRTKRVKVHKTDLEAIPAGSVIELEGTVFSKLKSGQVICVRSGRELALRRFVKIKIGAQETRLLVSHDGATESEEIPHNQLVGKVISATVNGKKFDPSRSGFLQNLLGKLGLGN